MLLPALKRMHAVVRGRVHAVGFRAFCQRQASSLGLCGWTRNIPGMTVEIVAEGSEQALRELESALHQGPALAQVRQLCSTHSNATGQLPVFEIREDGTRTDSRELRERFPPALDG